MSRVRREWEGRKGDGMGGEGEVVCGLLNKTEKNKLKKINQNSFALICARLSLIPLTTTLEALLVLAPVQPVAASAEKHHSTCSLFNVSCQIKHSSGTQIGSSIRKGLIGPTDDFQ